MLLLNLLGELSLEGDGAEIKLPASRKTRALLAFLAVSGRPQPRERLCELLWNVPDDPRGALRWSLSKLRPLLDEGDDKRIVADRQTVHLEPHDMKVDLLEAKAAINTGLQNVDTEDLKTMAGWFKGEALRGISLPDLPVFEAWRIAEQEDARVFQNKILRELIDRLEPGSEDALLYANKLLFADQNSAAAHITLLRNLHAAGQTELAEKQFDLGIKHLADIDPVEESKVIEAWRSVKSSDAPSQREAPTGSPDPAHEMVEEDPLLSIHLPSVAVLPFEVIGEEDSRTHLGEGIANDLITELSKFHSFEVAAKTTSFAFVDRNATIQEMGDEIGVKYVVDGSLQLSGDRVRISAHLMETSSGKELWAEQYDGEISNIFELQDRITSEIVEAIEPEISYAEREHARLKSADHLEHWEKYQRAIWHASQMSGSDLVKSRELLLEIIEAVPEFAQAHSYLAQTNLVTMINTEIGNREALLQEGTEAAKRSIALDYRDPQGHYAYGRMLALRNLHREAIEEYKTALKLNPRFVWANYGLGVSYHLMGDLEAAIAEQERVIRLSPRDPMVWSAQMNIGLCQHDLGRFAEAAESLLKARAFQSVSQWPTIGYISVLMSLGEVERAKEEVAEAVSQWPEFGLAQVRGYGETMHLNHRGWKNLLKNLEAAGLPE